MTKLLLLLKSFLEFFKKKDGQLIIDYIKQKYDQTTLKNAILYGLIAIIVLFIITKLSGVIVWMTIGAVVLVVGLKLIEKYFPKKE
jgi:small-conductance mechanosensitive channel